MDGDDVRELAEVVEELSIAPLGRNYFERYREIRDEIRSLAEEAEDGASADLIAERLDPDDVEFLEAIVRNLDTFAEQGFRREGQVEPYISARDDARRLEPYLELIEPHLSG